MATGTIVHSLPIRAAVLTVSDRCSRGEQADLSGDRIVARLAALPATIVARSVVGDEPGDIGAAVVTLALTCDLLITTGGTGLAPRDVTPDTIRPLLDREIPGMAEAMRAAGMRSTALAMLSRQVCGVRGACVVLVLPGSTAAVEESLSAVWETLPHLLRLVSGREVGHPKSAG